MRTVLSLQLDDLEPTLARHGYRLKDMTEQCDAKAAEIRAMFNNQLEPKRTAEIRERMLVAGLPIRQYEPSFAESVSRRPWNASQRCRLQAHLQLP